VAHAATVAQQSGMDAQDRDGTWQDTQGAQRGSAEVSSRGESSPRFDRAHRSRYTRRFAWLVAAIIGVAVVLIAAHQYRDWRARIALQDAARANTEAQQRAQAQADLQRREDEARRQRLQAQIEQQEALKTQAIRERQQADEQARQAAEAEAERKEKAWAKFYRRPPACTDAASLECANGYIRARRTFEVKYARGEL
jgi:hypothetical protein